MLFGQLAKIDKKTEYFNLYSTIQRNLKNGFYRISSEIIHPRTYGDVQALSYHFFPICCVFLLCCNNHKDNIDKIFIFDILNFVRNNYLPYVTDCGYLGGIAGYLDCLIELQRNNLIEIPQYYIEDAYKRLLEFEQTDNNLSFFPHYESTSGNSTSIPLGGFAHGSSGIALVLYKLFRDCRLLFMF